MIQIVEFLKEMATEGRQLFIRNIPDQILNLNLISKE